MSKHHPANEKRWAFWIDRGGTFTDIVGVAPGGSLHTHKLLSENNAHYEDAATAGIADILGVPRSSPLPADQIGWVKMGTTVATNALLERKGTPTVFVTTKGHRDALRIGTQHRPKIFELDINRPTPLADLIIEADERVDVDGNVLTALGEQHLRACLHDAFNRGYRAIAVCFLHGYKAHEHENKAAEIARAVGFTQISVSHQVSPLIRFVPRGDTTIADAYLSPVLRKYVDHVGRNLGISDQAGPRLEFMKSNGGLTDAKRFSGKDAILSGPAGGVIGAVRTAQKSGFNKVIGFDMGGTSTDVCHFDGTFEQVFQTVVAGARLRVPMMDVHTVAAGGGSILKWAGGRLQAGPQSAGADPGPKAYRRDGPLTVTDANLMVGRISEDYFPNCFGPNADEPLDRSSVEAAFTSFAQQANVTDAPTLADNFIEIAVDNMAAAIRKISIARGRDPADYALACFGGAGGQLGCRVGNALNMRTVLVHPYASVLSAFGIGLSDVKASRTQSVEKPFDADTLRDLNLEIDRLSNDAHKELYAQGFEASQITCDVWVLLKYTGADTALAVSNGPQTQMDAEFAERHKQEFGFAAPGQAITIDSVFIEAMAKEPEPKLPLLEPGDRPIAQIAQHNLFAAGEWISAPVFQRSDLRPGHEITGPALITDAHSTICVDPGWCGRVDQHGMAILERIAQDTQKPKRVSMGSADPTRLEIFSNLFMSIAEEMGTVLERTARSVNIRERLDFSCAVFDRDGNLIANAPHMPVHLGSMGDSVRTVIDQFANEMAPGDAFVLNSPLAGGTHLPDITVVTPVFVDGHDAPLFFTAARGHHADIGGISPGSMPPLSTHLDQEGVLINCRRLAQNDQFFDTDMRNALADTKYPARDPDKNIADLKAQLAACVRGGNGLLKACRLYGHDTVSAYMGFVQDNAEHAIREAIAGLDGGSVEVPMDNGAKICVEIKTDPETRSAIIDFTGTSDQQSDNFNAPASIAKAAVLYVFRCLVSSNIPLNDGCMRPLTIILPKRCILNPEFPAAVVAGNVETSQIVTDALLAACGVLAASQGTMNNFTFGDETLQYYETICGGAGAGATFAGADAVQTHMTNSRLTDAEILELRYPVVVDAFSVRQGSGGKGRYKGGNGVCRRIIFRKPMTAAILSGRRNTKPFGINGGGDGLSGQTWLHRKNGTKQQLQYRDTVDVKVGDCIEILTPGGGGFGTA